MPRLRVVPAALTRQAYWLAAAVPWLMPLGWALRDLPGMAVAFAWLTPAALYVLLPVLDALAGRDLRNPATTDRNALTDIGVPLAASLSYLGVLPWALWMLATHPGAFGPLDLAGWTVSLASLGGVVAINVSHELIHRRSAGMRNLGGLMLACVGYGCFKLEHPRWHHAKVATPEDPSSAPRGSTVYGQVLRALVLNTLHGWRLGFEAARRAGRPAWMNEMFAWYGITLGLAVAAFVVLGPVVGWVYLGHAVGSCVLLEVINYVEHYGLERERREDGRWVPPDRRHSWDADFWLSNAILLQLPRHADHHVNPSRPFPALQRSEEAPRLPFGYATALLVALVPPLWRRVTTPRLP